MDLEIWKIWRDYVWRIGLWSLVSCSPNSSGIVWEDSELLSWRKHTHTHTHTHTLSNLYLNERLDCCIFLIKYNIKMINNADVCFYFATIFDQYHIDHITPVNNLQIPHHY